jgi:hypothetical protein
MKKSDPSHESTSKRRPNPRQPGLARHGGRTGFEGRLIFQDGPPVTGDREAAIARKHLAQSVALADGVDVTESREPLHHYEAV